MTKQEIAQLVASLTDDEIEQLRDFLADPADSDPRGASNEQFAKTLFGGGD